MTDEERLYSLDEARRIVLREHCAFSGHKIELLGSNWTARWWGCSRCDVKIKFVWPEEEGEKDE